MMWFDPQEKKRARSEWRINIRKGIFFKPGFLVPIEMVLLFDPCSVPYFVRLLDGMFSRLCIWSLLRAPCLGISKSGRLQALCWVLPGNALKMGMFKSSSVVIEPVCEV